MENKARFKYILSSFALAFLLQQCGAKRTLARWLMPSPKSKKQICSWQTFVTLCQVSCAETERNGNTKYFVRRNTNNILWCNIYVICQGGTAASLWKQVRAKHGWKHVKCGDSVFSASCYLSFYGTDDCPKGARNHYLQSRTFAKRKPFQMGQSSPHKCEEGRCTTSGPYTARLWWRGGSKNVTCPQARAVEIAAAGRKEAIESQGPAFIGISDERSP